MRLGHVAPGVGGRRRSPGRSGRTNSLMSRSTLVRANLVDVVVLHLAIYNGPDDCLWPRVRRGARTAGTIHRSTSSAGAAKVRRRPTSQTPDPFGTPSGNRVIRRQLRPAATAGRRGRTSAPKPWSTISGTGQPCRTISRSRTSHVSRVVCQVRLDGLCRAMADLDPRKLGDCRGRGGCPFGDPDDRLAGHPVVGRERRWHLGERRHGPDDRLQPPGPPLGRGGPAGTGPARRRRRSPGRRRAAPSAGRRS